MAENVASVQQWRLMKKQRDRPHSECATVSGWEVDMVLEWSVVVWRKFNLLPTEPSLLPFFSRALSPCWLLPGRGGTTKKKPLETTKQVQILSLLVTSYVI